VTLDDELVRTLEQDYTQAPITTADRVMLDYVVQVTKDATRIGPQDHERLRSEGFDDRAILQITLIASWFNYINRVADALGVGRESATRTSASTT
jgi:alkylhydroperoxidase family enzyme